MPGTRCHTPKVEPLVTTAAMLHADSFGTIRLPLLKLDLRATLTRCGAFLAGDGVESLKLGVVIAPPLGVNVGHAPKLAVDAVEVGAGQLIDPGHVGTAVLLRWTC